ncbi:hypothetical protein ETAA8_65270 [Anatilimnocola aggregata]|uniref:Uncharacterized protein n=1 Tax=Anatilimnocola aggregata TaxID=2528021 RepID=A0A517YMC3_9BACT|nr:hypothetical protein [Anatilimnocola aggregata]QDU31370.1 hypothetical protein ETAA8_65270 [Anatilimnocola aggregata]
MKHLGLVIVAVAGYVLAGCSTDERLADLAQQVTHEQAAQNERMAEASQTVAQGSQQLVEADAQARRELIDLQHELRRDQAGIAQQRDVLEVERRELAQARHKESLITSGLTAVGMLLAALAPLVLAAISLVGLWRETTKEEEGQVFIEELAHHLLAEQRPLLPEPARSRLETPDEDQQPPPF